MAAVHELELHHLLHLLNCDFVGATANLPASMGAIDFIWFDAKSSQGTLILICPLPETTPGDYPRRLPPETTP